MSTEVEQNNSNDTSDTNNEETYKIDYSKLDKNELLKNNAFVKDLYVKLDVLKKGIVDERKKTALLVSKIKQLEDKEIYFYDKISSRPFKFKYVDDSEYQDIDCKKYELVKEDLIMDYNDLVEEMDKIARGK